MDPVDPEPNIVLPVDVEIVPSEKFTPLKDNIPSIPTFPEIAKLEALIYKNQLPNQFLN